MSINIIEFDQHKYVPFTRFLKNQPLAYNRTLALDWKEQEPKKALHSAIRGMITSVVEFHYETLERELKPDEAKPNEHKHGKFMIAIQESLTDEGAQQFKFVGAVTGHDLTDFLNETPTVAKDRKNEMMLTRAEAPTCYLIRDLFVDPKEKDAALILLNAIREHAFSKGYRRIVTAVPVNVPDGMTWYTQQGFEKAFTDRTGKPDVKYLMNPPLPPHDRATETITPPAQKPATKSAPGRSETPTPPTRMYDELFKD